MPQNPIRSVGHHSLNGYGNGGQVVVQRRGSRYYAFVGHLRGKGTSIVDVTVPDKPELIVQTEVPENTHSHKVRLSGDIMLVNNERQFRISEGLVHVAGLRIFDTKDISSPNEISFLPTGGLGVHRFFVDTNAKIAHISTGMDGYLSNIYLTVDISDPRKPSEIGRWWYPGQHLAGGEKPSWDWQSACCRGYSLHHPLLLGSRAYAAYWDGGVMVLDCSNQREMRLVSRLPAYTGHTHTALPVAREIGGRKILVVFEECVGHKVEPRKFMYVVDISEETKPEIISTFDVPGSLPPDVGRYGPHQPFEDTQLTNNLIYATWYAAGLRILDLSDPLKPVEIASYLPPAGEGQQYPQTNDVYVDDRGLIYLIDRVSRGLDIVEYKQA